MPIRLIFSSSKNSDAFHIWTRYELQLLIEIFQFKHSDEKRTAAVFIVFSKINYLATYRDFKIIFPPIYISVTNDRNAFVIIVKIGAFCVNVRNRFQLLQGSAIIGKLTVILYQSRFWKQKKIQREIIWRNSR